MTEIRKNTLVQEITFALDSDLEFGKTFVTCEDAAALQQALKSKGIEASVEEITEFINAGVENIKAQNADELSEEALDNVAGGGWGRYLLRAGVSVVAAAGYGALCGVCPAACAGAPYVAVGLTAWTAAGYFK